MRGFRGMGPCRWKLYANRWVPASGLALQGCIPVACCNLVHVVYSTDPVVRIYIPRYQAVDVQNDTTCGVNLSPVVCVAVCTGSPTNPSNVLFACGSTTVAGQACSAACSSGYTAGSDGLPRSTCSPTGNWGAVSGSCIPIGMVAPYLPSHSFVSQEHLAAWVQRRQEQCVIQCVIQAQQPRSW
jgi:hypothetical protein